MAQDAVLKQIELTTFDEAVNGTDEFTLQAPAEPGEYAWTAVYAAQEKEDTLHETSSTSFSFVVKPHTISLSSWDAPFPAVLGSRFTLKVGARCAAGCRLAGERVEVYDQQGARVAAGTLGDELWQGTDALYWAELELRAPDEEGLHKWELKCPKPGLEPTHEESAHTFAFRTARPPEHVATIEIISQDIKTPIEKAAVSLYSRAASYRGFSDNTGVARVSVPKGEYNLAVVAHDYKEWESTVEVASDVSVKVELSFWPEA
jgi:hypothetical protein